MTKDFFKQTAKQYIEKYPSRLKVFLDEFEADEVDFIEKELKMFDELIYDLENIESVNDGYGIGSLVITQIAEDVIEELGWDKFHYSLKKKISFLESEKNKITEQDMMANSNISLKNYTNSQLVLIFYYFFKYSGIEPRVDTDIAPIAKFLHLITGKKFSNTQNSDFYKKLLKAPNHIGDKSLTDDLNHIKPLFQKVDLNEIVKMIDNEIDQCKTAIKETKTGKR